MEPEFSLATLTSAARAVNYSMFASLAFLFYDHVLSFDAEKEYIWNQRLSFGKVLFILNRYFGPLTIMINIFVYTSKSVTVKFCEGFHWWETTSEAIAVLTAEVILVTRIYAVYDRNKKLLIILAGCFLAEIASTLVLVDLGLPRGIPRPYSELSGCYVTNPPALYFMTWIPALTFETFLCLLMLYKAWMTYKGEHTSSLLRLIIRDSILYFLTMFVTLLVNCLIWAFGSENILEIALGWAVAMPCTLGSRLLLNMRARYSQEMPTWNTVPVEMEFRDIRSLRRAEGNSSHMESLSPSAV